MARTKKTEKELAQFQTVTARLVEWCGQRGFAEVARRSNLPRQTLYGFSTDNKQTLPSLDTLWRIKAAYGDELDMNWLMTGEKVATIDSAAYERRIQDMLTAFNTILSSVHENFPAGVTNNPVRSPRPVETSIGFH